MRHRQWYGPIGRVDLGNLGLGDCVTALAVLRHLRLVEPSVLSPECVIVLPDALRPLGAHLVESPGVKVVSRGESAGMAVAGRQLILRPPKTLRELVQWCAGRAIYLNWSEGHGLAVSHSGRARSGGLLRQVRFSILELCQFKTINWRTTAPAYIGFRLMFPLVARSSQTLTWHVLKIKSSLPPIRGSVAAYYHSWEERHPSDPLRGIAGKVVVFPGAASFNAMSPELCEALKERFGDRIAFALHQDDPWLSAYRTALREVIIVRTVEDTLGLLIRNHPVCVDGFVSHLVQLVKDDALIIYTREPRERLTHPGAYPRILEAHPDCSPCAYTLRARNELCPAGRPHCVAFDQMRDRLIAAIEAI